MYDVAVIGGGIAGMATTARLQARGFSTVILEAHSHVGGCAGYFRKQGFAFDVGATTLVDFEAEGVGGELLSSIGLELPEAEMLPGYVAWLPDRRITLYRDTHRWSQERLAAFGSDSNHRAFWGFLDRLAETFWDLSRNGIKLPVCSFTDLLNNLQSISTHSLPLFRYLAWTMGDALHRFNLQQDIPLRALLSMLIEDTVHSTVDDAPLINAALGVTIRGAGLTRHRGGMWGFWKRFVTHYRVLGGRILTACKVASVVNDYGKFIIHTSRGIIEAHQVVSAIPADLTARIAPQKVAAGLQPYLHRDRDSYGGAVVVFLGVPETEIDGQAFTHHQLLQEYHAPLGNGNNMFISVSSPGDIESAPDGYRAVMISTHCDLNEWTNLSPELYRSKKESIGDCLVSLARRVYPNLGNRPRVYEIGTPPTYQHFTGRINGAVGGVKQTLLNSNQNAIPHETNLRGFWMVGDSTWPGLGTVACVLGSRIVADKIADRR